MTAGNLKSPVLGHALQTPVINWLQKTVESEDGRGKRPKVVVLASSSPRRKELLNASGLDPLIVPSTFAENLPHSDFTDRLAEYPVTTALEKAQEVYFRLTRESVEGVTDNAANGASPDVVISADTVIIFPPQRGVGESAEAERALDYGSQPSRILEKPDDRQDQLRMLEDMNGKSCEVVTGVVVLQLMITAMTQSYSVIPTVNQPGYKVCSISISTIVNFYKNSVRHSLAVPRVWPLPDPTIVCGHFASQPELLEAYIKSGEGVDRAGGFAIQGLGGRLVNSIEGDYNNVVGFPTSAFWRWMDDQYEEGHFDD